MFLNTTKILKKKKNGGRVLKREMELNETAYVLYFSSPWDKITLSLVIRKSLVLGMLVETWISHKLLRKELILCLILL